MHFLQAFNLELLRDGSFQLLFSTLSLDYADFHLKDRIDRVLKLQACLQRLAGFGADYCKCHARPGPDAEGRLPFFVVGLVEDSVPAVRVLLLRLRTCPECQHATSDSTCPKRQDATSELQPHAVAVVECNEVSFSPQAPPKYLTYYTVVDPAFTGQPHNGYTWVRTTDEAAAWLEGRGGREAGPLEGLLRRLDFSTPLHCRRMVSHALMAVADWALMFGQSGTRCGFTSAAAAALTEAQRVGNLAAALHPWALVAQRDPQLLLYGSAVRPYIPFQPDRVSADGASLLEVLSAPPFNPGLARSRAKALRLQRLAALLVVHAKDQEVTSQLSTTRLTAKILELMYPADDGSDKHDHGRDQQQQRHRAPHLQGEGDHLQAPVGPHSTEPVSGGRGGSTRSRNAVEELLRELGIQPKEVLMALQEPEHRRNIAICAQCGRHGALAACNLCVDSFCSHCLGGCDLPRLHNSWCCWYCVSVLSHLTRDEHGAASDLYEAITRLTAHGLHAGNRLGLVSDEVASLLTSACVLHLEHKVDYLMHMPDLWTGFVTVSGWAVRQLTELYDSAEAPPLGRDSTGVDDGGGAGAGASAASPLVHADAEVLYGVCALLDVMLRIPSYLGPNLQLHPSACVAFLRGEFLQACSRLLAAAGRTLQLGSAPARADLELLRLVLSDVSGLVSAVTACAQRSMDDGLFAELVVALYDSQLLEHLARALLWLQETLVGALVRWKLEGEDMDLVSAPLNPHLIRHDLRDMLLRIPLSLMKRLKDATATEKAATRRGEAAARHLEVLVPLLRRCLSGPCLQYLVGRDLVAARWRLTGGEGHTYGLTHQQMDMATPFGHTIPLNTSLEAHLLEQLFESALLWQVTVRVSPSQPTQQPAAQSAPGPTGPGPGFSGATWWADGLWARALPYNDHPPAGPPYSVIALYEMVYSASADVVAAWTGGTFMKLTTSVQLLMHLAAELGPLRIKNRLPKLWQLLAQVLMLEGEIQETDFISHIGKLMVRDWPVDGAGEQQEPATAGQQGRAEAVVQQPDQGTADHPTQQAQQDQQQAMTEQQPGSGAMDIPSAAPSNGNGGPGPVAGAYPTADCAFGLRCALNGGLLPAVEGMVRRHHSRTPFEQLASTTFRLYAVDAMLRGPGVWPAVMAHGSFREVASLIATLRKVPTLAALPTRQGCRDTAWDTDSRPRWIATSSILALLEQTAAVLLPRAPKADVGKPCCEDSAIAAGGSDDGDVRRSGSGRNSSSTATGDADGAAASGSSPSGGGDGGSGASTSTFVASPPPASAPLSLIQLNDSCNTAIGLPPVHLQHLLQAAGGPPSGWAADARQQARLLTVFALVQWLPFAIEVPPMMGPVGPATWFLVLVAARQCLAAASAGLADPYQSWRRFLLTDLDVLTWLAAVIEACTAPSSAAAASNQELLSAALDVLDVLAVLWPLKFVLRVAGHGAAGTGTGMVAVLKGRCGPRLVVEEMRGPRSRRPDSTGLRPPRFQLVRLHEGEPDALPNVAALGSEVAAKHNLAHLPLLPSPEEAAQAAAAAGVRVCGHPDCPNMEGPSEAALTAAGGKTCSRCKAVWYCCGACQLAHWRERHQGECGRMGR